MVQASHNLQYILRGHLWKTTQIRVLKVLFIIKITRRSHFKYHLIVTTVKAPTEAEPVIES